MIVKEEKRTVGGDELVLRCLSAGEAEEVLSGYIKMTGEAKFLAKFADEINLTLEQEKAFINRYNSDSDKLLLGAFVNGRYAGNCSYAGKSVSRKTAHRAVIGIAIFEEFTGRGIGGLLMGKALAEAKKAGFKQMELTVYSGNERARRLYARLGFAECGRLPDAVNIDGEYFDEIEMYKKL